MILWILLGLAILCGGPFLIGGVGKLVELYQDEFYRLKEGVSLRRRFSDVRHERDAISFEMDGLKRELKDAREAEKSFIQQNERLTLQVRKLNEKVSQLRRIRRSTPPSQPLEEREGDRFGTVEVGKEE